MKAEDLKDPIDRQHALREEKRHRVATYKDRPVRPRDKVYTIYQEFDEYNDISDIGEERQW